jgi:hypothetical protein
MPAHIQWLGVSNWWPEDRMWPNLFAAAACKSFFKTNRYFGSKITVYKQKHSIG